MSDMIAAGKALYWGTSEWSAAEIAAAWQIADKHHLHKPVMEQPQYNLLHRDRVEKEYARLYARPRHRHDHLEPARLRTSHRQVQRRHPGGLARHGQGLRMAGRAPDRPRREIAKVRKTRADRRRPRLHAGADGARVVPQESRTCPPVITGASRPAQVHENMKALDVVPKLAPDGDGAHRRRCWRDRRARSSPHVHATRACGRSQSPVLRAAAAACSCSPAATAMAALFGSLLRRDDARDLGVRDGRLAACPDSPTASPAGRRRRACDRAAAAPRASAAGHGSDSPGSSRAAPARRSSPSATTTCTRRLPRRLMGFVDDVEFVVDSRVASSTCVPRRGSGTATSASTASASKPCARRSPKAAHESARELARGAAVRLPVSRVRGSRSRHRARRAVRAAGRRGAGAGGDLARAAHRARPPAPAAVRAGLARATRRAARALAGTAPDEARAVGDEGARHGRVHDVVRARTRATPCPRRAAPSSFATATWAAAATCARPCSASTTAS